MTWNLSSHRLRMAGATALGLLALATVPAGAQTAPAFDFSGAPAGATAAVSPSADLAPLLAASSDLQFSGEASHRVFPVFVTGEQSTKEARLTLGYTSAVSVAPEGSSLVVSVNGVEIVSQAIRVGSAQSLDLPVPPGLLRPGFNAVGISMQQFHRVDCSVQGTYELWTSFDPAASGLRFPRTGAAVAGFADLPALPRDGQGKVRIAGLVPEGSTAERTDNTLAAIEAAVVIGAMDDPLVQLGREGGSDAVLDVVVGTMDEIGPLARQPGAQTPWPGVSLLPAAVDRPATLVVTGSTAGDVRKALDQLRAGAQTWAPDGSQAGLQAIADRRGRAVSGHADLRLDALGVDGRPFAGRLFREDLRLSLPADFYAADYDAASLVLNGAYAANLSADATLFVRANGQVVATLPLSSPQPGRIEDKRLKVPLNRLKPGPNTISIEALVPNAEDEACEATAGGERPARFALSGDTRLELPALARVGSYPNLSATLAGVGSLGAADRDLMVYVPGNDPSARDAAATIVARMAASSGTVRQPRFVNTLPHAEGGDLLAVGTYSSLPNDLASALRLRDGTSAFALSETPTGWSGVSEANASTMHGEAPADVPAPDATTLSAFADPVGVGQRVAEITRPVTNAIHNAVATYRERRAEAPRELPQDGALLVQAATPAPGTAWTVFTAPTSALLTQGLHRLGTPTTWNAIDGARTDIPAAADQALVSTNDDKEMLFETQPRSISNARLVLAGWFSRHSDRYAALMFASSILLAVSTFLLLRRLGEKKS
ncbi:cellulose biosynthesis cyclic di-GMP-binding regulatory protein BcsB [Aureimonas phyllosphaerae]|uniref:cellulose biosynthesis cyclic di-GMP-binding regulatory protein BcsB n=1 Tax=Aureimonas phyllosphaerae TaxID=1166078 RepID=UPI003A5BDEEF